MKLAQLNAWPEEIGRRDYILWALILGAIKFNVDRLVLKVVFGVEWDIARYLQWNFPSLFAIDPFVEEGAWMLAASLPFLWAGMALTVQRLRSAHLPLWLAGFFVVPTLKWFLFALASLAPARRDAVSPAPNAEGETWLDCFWPHSRIASALAAVIAAAAITTLGVLVAAQWLASYGWGLFVGLPFLSGFLAAMTHGRKVERSLSESAGVALLSIAVAGIGFLIFAIEGLICLLMAAPLAIPLALIGGVAGHAIQPARWRRAQSEVWCAAFLTLPWIASVESIAPAPAPLVKVTTAIEIQATPEVVWQHVVAFTELPPPTEWVFRAGIAYPIRADIRGHGPGAIRYCVFSTGSFVEPIEEWDAPRRLSFSVTANPAPMEEWTPYKQIHPPHLEGFLQSERGQFKLTRLPDGRTALEGTTWYRHSLWPARYWQLWSDSIIHTIHRRVLDHIKQVSERGAI